MIELYDSPEEIVSMLKNFNPYVIKIKCIACSETPFMPFQHPVINGNTLTIGCCSYPLSLLEYVVVRYTEDFGTSSIKREETYKVKASYLQTLLNEHALQELKQFNLLSISKNDT